jgi:hypothetical protein
MTAMETAMTDEPGALGGQLGRIALIVLGLFGAVFGVGLVVGILAAHVDRGEAPGLGGIGLLAGGAALAAAFAWLAYRSGRAMRKVIGTPTSRERRNYAVLLLSGALGGVIGMALTLGGGSPLDAFTNSPLPAWLAILIAIPIAVLLPVICVYWHRHAVDEQEAAAYKLGALLGIYTYFIGAPTWWVLWRGGLLPAPDGIAIYLVTLTVTGVTWLWAKYR